MANNQPISYDIIMDAKQVEAVLTETATLFPRYINSWLAESAELTKTEMKAEAPVGVAGMLGQGISNNIGITYDRVEMAAHIKPTDQAPYADAVETGSQAHMPPAGPDSSLAQWCEMHGLNVWAVANSIKRNGTKPHPFIEPTYQVVKPQISELFSRGVGTYIESVAT